MPNRLRHETSPYLRQHADNPVDWYPWGEEALARARAEGRPILLSIGYAACHWCHVMAHESFEDPETAALMNARFVCVKVDREERPDLDGLYMAAVVAMTGGGGWPMTVSLTPDGEPFFGGTYFPREPRHGMPSFRRVLTAVADAWDARRDEVIASARSLSEQLARAGDLGARPGPLVRDVLERAARAIGEQYEPRHGGFGPAPKFPQPMTLEFLLRHHLRTGDATALRMVEHSLERMAAGGIRDHLAGGFARYATDDRWLVPHFEKMLYDNAQLARVYLHAWRVTGRAEHRRVAEETLDWALAELRDPRGGFYSSLDADSEGEEGRFYAWTADEVRSVLGADADLFLRAYGVTDAGNWEGRNVLHAARTVEDLAAETGLTQADVEIRLDTARRALLAARSRRVRPGLDDKVLTAWNGLLLATLAEGGVVLGRDDYVAAATACAEFLRRTVRTPEGRLLRSWSPRVDDGAGPSDTAGFARGNAFLEDHACLAEGLLALYAATFDARWLSWAREIADLMVARFADPDGPGFYDVSDDHERLLHRPRDPQDNAVPSGGAMATTVLLQLALLTGEAAMWDRAEGALAGMVDPMARHPLAFGQWLVAASFALGSPRELAIAGDLGADDTRALLAAARAAWRPDLAVAVGTAADARDVLLLADRERVDGRATAYLCRAFGACEAPTTDHEVLRGMLEARD